MALTGTEWQTNNTKKKMRTHKYDRMWVYLVYYVEKTCVYENMNISNMYVDVYKTSNSTHMPRKRCTEVSTRYLLPQFGWGPWGSPTDIQLRDSTFHWVDLVDPGHGQRYKRRGRREWWIRFHHHFHGSKGSWIVDGVNVWNHSIIYLYIYIRWKNH